MKILNYLFIAAAIVGLVYIFSLLQEFSYVSLSKNYTEIGTLLLRPLDYNGGTVCTAGKYTKGEGVSELRDAQNPTEAIWIVGSVEQSIFSSLWQNYISQDTYKTAFVRVCGKFETTQGTNRGFGNNNSYTHQIVSNY